MGRRKFPDERVLGCILGFSYVRGYMPTMREVAEALGVAETTVRNALHRLAEDGVIEFRPYVARGVRLLG